MGVWGTVEIHIFEIFREKYDYEYLLLFDINKFLWSLLHTIWQCLILAEKMVPVIMSNYLDLCALGKISLVNILNLVNCVIINFFKDDSLLKQYFCYSLEYACRLTHVHLDKLKDLMPGSWAIVYSFGSVCILVNIYWFIFKVVYWRMTFQTRVLNEWIEWVALQTKRIDEWLLKPIVSLTFSSILIKNVKELACSHITLC